MTHVDYLIIGGGIAGTTCAEFLRARDSHAVIAILEKEHHPLYSRVLIPQYLKGRISREQLFLRKLGDYERAHIGFYGNAVVGGIDTNRREVHGVFEGGSETFSYKKLCIASGGAPRILPPTYSFGENISLLRMQTLDDADTIKDVISKAPTKEALVIGEGFIAMEFLETFLVNGIRPHILCREGAFAKKRFGEAGARLLEAYYEKHGVRFYKNIKDEEMPHYEGWLVDGREKIVPSLVGVGIGISRAIEVFSGVEKNIGILTNEYLETNIPEVFAAGDVAEYYDTIEKRRRVVGNWTSAFGQGRLAAQNMAGEHVTLHTVPTYTLINVGLNITTVGSTDNFDTEKEYIGHPMNPFLVRLLFKEKKLTGAVLINRFLHKKRLAEFIAEGASYDDVEKEIRE